MEVTERERESEEVVIYVPAYLGMFTSHGFSPASCHVFSVSISINSLSSSFLYLST